MSAASPFMCWEVLLAPGVAELTAGPRKALLILTGLPKCARMTSSISASSVSDFVKALASSRFFS